MSRVFIGGSRKLSKLNEEIQVRLDGVLASSLEVLIGDANGADKAVQTYLAGKGYKNVTLYCSGDECRNNVGNWTTRHVRTASAIKDFEHYSQKDKEMAREADYGLFLWDGESRGTLENIRRMVEQGKTSLVYLSGSRTFITVRSSQDLRSLPSTPKRAAATGRRSMRKSKQHQAARRLL